MLEQTHPPPCTSLCLPPRFHASLPLREGLHDNDDDDDDDGDIAEVVQIPLLSQSITISFEIWPFPAWPSL